MRALHRLCCPVKCSRLKQVLVVCVVGWCSVAVHGMRAWHSSRRISRCPRIGKRCGVAVYQQVVRIAGARIRPGLRRYEAGSERQRSAEDLFTEQYARTLDAARHVADVAELRGADPVGYLTYMDVLARAQLVAQSACRRDQGVNCQPPVG
jgi:hypothetical protein